MGTDVSWAVRMAASSRHVGSGMVEGHCPVLRPDRPGLAGQGSGSKGERTAGQPSLVKLGNSGLLTALGMRVCALNEELGLAPTSQQAYSSVYKDLVSSRPGRQGQGGSAFLRTWSQRCNSVPPTFPHHFTCPLPSSPETPHGQRLGEGRWEWTWADGQPACCSQEAPSPSSLWSPVAAASQQVTPLGFLQ